MDHNAITPQTGWDVVGSDGDKVGEIDAVEQNYIVVRKGFFFPTDYFIPFSAVSSAEEGRVYLNVTKDDALNQQWDVAPDSTQYGDEAYTETNAAYRDDTTTGGYVADTDAGYREDAAATGRSGYVSDIDSTDTVGTTRGYDDNTQVRDAVYDEGKDHTTIERSEEELVATKRDEDRGAVRVNKDVVEEQQTIDVPVREEEVNVTRRSVNREGTGDHAFEEGTIEIPVRGEVVDVEKRNRVVEEIDIDKTAKEHTEHVTDTVRKERVNVEGDNLDAETRRGADYDRTGDRYDDDRSLLDKAKDAVDTDNDGKIGR